MGGNEYAVLPYFVRHLDPHSKDWIMNPLYQPQVPTKQQPTQRIRTDGKRRRPVRDGWRKAPMYHGINSPSRSSRLEHVCVTVSSHLIIPLPSYLNVPHHCIATSLYLPPFLSYFLYRTIRLQTFIGHCIIRITLARSNKPNRAQLISPNQRRGKRASCPDF
jgi:hypothetical protein